MTEKPVVQQTAARGGLLGSLFGSGGSSKSKKPGSDRDYTATPIPDSQRSTADWNGIPYHRPVAKQNTQTSTPLYDFGTAPRRSTGNVASNSPGRQQSTKAASAGPSNTNMPKPPSLQDVSGQATTSSSRVANLPKPPALETVKTGADAGSSSSRTTRNSAAVVTNSKAPASARPRRLPGLNPTVPFSRSTSSRRRGRSTTDALVKSELNSRLQRNASRVSTGESDALAASPLASSTASASGNDGQAPRVSRRRLSTPQTQQRVATNQRSNATSGTSSRTNSTTIQRSLSTKTTNTTTNQAQQSIAATQRQLTSTGIVANTQSTATENGAASSRRQSIAAQTNNVSTATGQTQTGAVGRPTNGTMQNRVARNVDGAAPGQDSIAAAMQRDALANERPLGGPVGLAPPQSAFEGLQPVGERFRSLDNAVQPGASRLLAGGAPRVARQPMTPPPIPSNPAPQINNDGATQQPASARVASLGPLPRGVLNSQVPSPSVNNPPATKSQNAAATTTTPAADPPSALASNGSSNATPNTGSTTTTPANAGDNVAVNPPAMAKANSLEANTAKDATATNPTPGNNAAESSDSKTAAANAPAAQIASAPTGTNTQLPADSNRGTTNVSESTTVSKSTASGNATPVAPDDLTQLPGIRVVTIAPKSLMIRQKARWEVRVENRGGVNAPGIMIQAELPENAKVYSHSVTDGETVAEDEYSTGEILWQLPALGAGKTQSMFVEMAATKAGEYELLADWTLLPQQAIGKVRVQEPKLAVNITGPAKIVYGDKQRYKIVVSNPGDGVAPNVIFTLGDDTTSQQQRAIGDIPPGKETDFEIELSANSREDLLISGTATGDLGLRTTGEKKIEVLTADLEAVISGPAAKFQATDAEYTIQVVNHGTTPCKNVDAIVQLPPGVAYAGGIEGASEKNGQLTWTIDQLEIEQPREFTMQCKMSGSGMQHLAFAAKGTALGETSVAMDTEVRAIADLVLHRRGVCRFHVRDDYRIPV
ncbi:MAG: hypothetical protein AAFN70_00725, partial [Planctomycetota bacterium]